MVGDVGSHGLEAGREDVLSSVFDAMLDPLVVVEAVRDEQGDIVDMRYVEANVAALTFLHLDRGALLGQLASDLFPAASNDIFLAWCTQVIATGQPLAVDDQRLTTKGTDNGDRFDVQATLAGDHVALTWRDVTEWSNAQNELTFLATHDPLTRLLNRRGFDDLLTTVLSHDPRRGVHATLLYCDLDGFKSVNDVLGHAAGDAVLVEVARRLTDSVRGGDHVARLGGDEFAILLPETDRPPAVNIVAHKIRHAIAEQVDVGTATIRTGISVGIAYAQPGEEPEGLLHRADTALQRAKRGAGINADGGLPA